MFGEREGLFTFSQGVALGYFKPALQADLLQLGCSFSTGCVLLACGDSYSGPFGLEEGGCGWAGLILFCVALNPGSGAGVTVRGK